jgi:hypothetical protein
MRRTGLALMLLLVLAGAVPVFGQNSDAPPRIDAAIFSIARYIGGRELASGATFGSIFGFFGIFPLWDVPVPFNPTTDLAKELDIVIVELIVFDQELADPNSTSTTALDFFYQVHAFAATVGPPEPPPLYGATTGYVSRGTPPAADPNFGPGTVDIVIVLQIPEFSGVNQRRLQGDIPYDVGWTVEASVAKTDTPTDAARGVIIFPLFAIENATLRPPNPPPIADAGSNQAVPAGSTVILDGSRSFDSANLGFDPLDPNIFEKDTLRYTWEWLSGPEEVDPVPDPADPANARVTLITVTTPDNPYVYRLLVSDEVNALPASAIVHIFVQSSIPVNHAPRAAITSPAGPVTVGNLVQLSGLASFDPDGNPLTYRWRQTNSIGGDLLPDEIQKNFQPLNGVTSAVASWRTTAAGTYYFTLVVTDPSGLANSAGPVAVNVVAAAVAGASQANSPAQNRDVYIPPPAETTPASTGCGAGGLFPLALLPGLLWVMRGRR